MEFLIVITDQLRSGSKVVVLNPLNGRPREEPHLIVYGQEVDTIRAKKGFVAMTFPKKQVCGVHRHEEDCGLEPLLFDHEAQEIDPKDEDEERQVMSLLHNDLHAPVKLEATFRTAMPVRQAV